MGNHIGGTTLSKKYGVNFYNDFHRLNLQMRDNEEKGKKYTCNIEYFKDINTEEKAYWFGFIYGDGYLTQTQNTLRFGLSIMQPDYLHMVKFKNAINFDGNINTYEVSSSGYKIGTKYCRIIISDDIFSKNLVSHGLVEHKSNIMKAPIGIPEELVRHWIRGFMDANGSIMITKNKDNDNYSYQIGFTSTEEVLDYIQSYLLKYKAINRTYQYRKRKKDHIVTQLAFGGNYQVKQFLDFIYENANIWLDRKHERYLELCKLLNDRKDSKRIKACAYCGDTNSCEYNMWLHGGEYNGKILCRKHYTQLSRFGKIIPDKSSRCDICGENNGKLTRVSKKYPEYQGKTLCLKHYNQLMYYGYVIGDKHVD